MKAPFVRVGIVYILLAWSATAVAATFTVTSIADSGPGTLRWAIEQANATPGVNTVTFAFSGATTISVASALPPVTGQARIMNSSVFEVTIDGTAAGPNTDGLVLQGSGITVFNLVLTHFSGDGLVVAGNSNVAYVRASYNFHGIRVEGKGNKVNGWFPSTGVQPDVSSNRSHGIWLTASAAGTEVGEELPVTCCPECYCGGGFVTVTGNAGDGLRIDGNHSTVNALPISLNGGDGIRVNGDDNSAVFGGNSSWVHNNAGNGITLAGNRNTVSGYTIKGNGGDGIRVTGLDNALINNETSVNGGSGLTLNASVLFEANFGACNPNQLVATNNGLQPPVILSATTTPYVMTVSGALTAVPDTRFRLDFVTQAPFCPIATLLPFSDLSALPGSRTVTVVTDDSGASSFTALVPLFYGIDPPDTVSVIATRILDDDRAAGGTSPSSAPVHVTASAKSDADLEISAVAPASAYIGQTITTEYTVRNLGPAASPGAVMGLGGQLTVGPGVRCESGQCVFDPFLPGDTRTVRRTFTMPDIAGGVYLDQALIQPGASDSVTSNNTSYRSITILTPPTVPALSQPLIAALALMIALFAVMRLRA